jgi:hypothetical protein
LRYNFTNEATMIRILIASFFLLLASACAGNNTPSGPTGDQFVCTDIDGAACVEFVSGWNESDARSSCNTLASTFRTGADGPCRSGRTSHCTVSSGAQVTVFNYYSNFGDGTIDYAQMTCQAMRGDFALN